MICQADSSGYEFLGDAVLQLGPREIRSESEAVWNSGQPRRACPPPSCAPSHPNHTATFLSSPTTQLNKVNAIVASRVASAFTTYRQYDEKRQAAMRAQLTRIAAAEGLCENVYEIVSKSLEQQ